MSNMVWKQSRRRLVVYVAALILALAATYTPVLLDGLAGASLTPTAAACEHPGAGC